MNETEAIRIIAEAISRAQAGGDVEAEAERAVIEMSAHEQYRLVSATGDLGSRQARAIAQPDAPLSALLRAEHIERLHIDAHRNNHPAWRQAQLAGLRIQTRLVTPWTDRKDTTP